MPELAEYRPLFDNAEATSRWRLTREPLACCSPIALPARRRRACLLRDTRFRSR